MPDRRSGRVGGGGDVVASGRIRAAWLLIALVALVAGGPGWGGIGDLEISDARDPVFVPLQIGPVATALGADWTERHAAAARFDEAVATAAREHPGRLLTLWVRDVDLRYESLDDDRRAEVRRSAPAGADPAEWYERGMARMLGQVVARARARHGGLRLAVLGLPLEPARAGGVASATSSNARYIPVLRALDAFVSSRTIILAGSGRDE
ncbi:MAG: hypothetical protein ACYTJ0_15530, partial [Planctomycetota bacterium]